MKFLRIAIACALSAAITGAWCQSLYQQKEAVLEVPTVPMTPDCPPAGWCGEAAVQMICMFYGCYFPQKMINKVGQPGHPDLWSNDFGKVWTALGFAWSDQSTGDPDEFIARLKASLKDGVPVLMGINVFSHGNGGAHFCIANKCDDESLYVNTTWSFAPLRQTWAKLRTKEDGISLADPFQFLAVPAPKILAAHRLRLYPVDSKSFFTPKCKLRIEAAHLSKGAKYQIRTYPSLASADVNRGGGDIVGEFQATDATYSQQVEIDSDQPCVFVLTPVRG